MSKGRDWKVFLRIRVGLKVSEPLVDEFWLSLGAKWRRWIVFKYEKLQKFCFACEKLGQLLKNYGDEVKMAAYDQSKMRFGAQMRGFFIRERGNNGVYRRFGRNERGN